MFGRDKLAQDGAKAQAVVLGAKARGPSGYIGPNPYTGTWKSAVAVHLRVHFDDGSTLDTTCRFGGAFRGADASFSVGDVVPVLYDPADRSKVEIDKQALEARTDANAKQSKEYDQLAISRAEARLHEEELSRPGAPGSTRRYVKAELERARRFNTPIGILVSQKLQEAWVAGQIQTEGGDELAMRKAFEDLRDAIRRDATEELRRRPTSA